MLMTSLRLCAVALLLCFAMGFLATGAHAADSAGGSDKTIATKEGVAESLGTKEFDDDKLPGMFEIGIAMGSCVALIAVIKYL